MPQKNSHKIYYPDAFYHVYNRGVEKRIIFEDEQDYAVFLHLLKTALWEPEKVKEEQERTFGDRGAILQKPIFHPRKNFYGRINFLCYCLMPNHYHFLIQQKDSEAVSKFIHSLGTSYCMYFNKKYERVGPLFQGIFKAVDVHEENYFLWLSRYIHRNPQDFKNYKFSSYPDYLEKRKTEWVNKGILLSYLQGSTLQNGYQAFVETEKDYPLEFESLILEEA